MAVLIDTFYAKIGLKKIRDFSVIFFVISIIFLLTLTKGTVFFFPRKSLLFATFREILSEWVEIPFFFFPEAGKKKQPRFLSEWVHFKLFLGKKKI